MDESREWDEFQSHHTMDLDIPENLEPDIDINDLDICKYFGIWISSEFSGTET
jgi:hypothetical protein